MRIAVLSGAFDENRAGWHARDLRRAAEARGHCVMHACWRRLLGSVATDHAIARDGPCQLDTVDAVIVRTMPPGSLEQVVFRMDLLGRLESAGVQIINRPRAIETAIDKYLCQVRLAEADVPTPPTVVCQRYADAIEAFELLGGDVVIKPIFGSEGFGTMRVCEAEVAERVSSTLERVGSVVYIQKFIDHGGSDLRLFVVEGVVLAAMRRCGSDFRTNIAKGGVGEPYEPSELLSALAQRAARACDVSVAGVDIVLDQAGQPFVLEVNAVPGWRALGRITGIDIANDLLQWLEGFIEHPRSSR